MNHIYNFLIEKGFNTGLATSFINAFCETMFLMFIILLHRAYLVYRDINEVPTEELTEDKIEETVTRTMKKYWSFGLSVTISITYPILFAVEYFALAEPPIRFMAPPVRGMDPLEVQFTQ